MGLGIVNSLFSMVSFSVWAHTKQVGKEAENAKVSVRNICRDAIDQAKKAEKAKEITEDELHTLEKDIQKVTDDSVKNIDKLAANKEKELLEV